MDMRPKQCRDTQKSSKVKETKKCETSEQRAKKYSPFKTLVVGGLLATRGMISAEGRQLQNSEQNNITRPESNSIPVPPGFSDYLRGMKLPESTIRDVERRVLSEQRRKLKAVVRNLDCLDVSASEVTGSVVSSLPDTTLPGVMERADFVLNVRNKCPVKIDGVGYQVIVRAECAPPAQPPETARIYNYLADPTSIGVGENSGSMAGDPMSALGGCQNFVNDVPVSYSLPSKFEVQISADGIEQNTLQSVYSQPKNTKLI